MAKAISARRKGDEYQARFAWVYLLRMRTDDFIESVIYESDDVSFVDDIIVNYSPAIKDQTNGKLIDIDYFQCKKHVTANGSFNYKNLIDPSFINNKESMLYRLYSAYESLIGQGKKFRLNIVSNWSWHPEDILAKHLSEYRIRDSFFLDSPTSKLGLIRNEFKKHLQIDDKELHEFFNILRFSLGKDLPDIQELIQPLLKLASLKQIDLSTSINVYDEIIWKWFDQGINTFDKQKLEMLLDEEGLIASNNPPQSEISVQSFLQFAKKPFDKLNLHLDLSDYFNARYIKNDNDWNDIITSKVSSFFHEERLKSLITPIHLFFDCHLSISFLIGYLNNPKYGIQIIPVHKNAKTGFDIWERPHNNEELNWQHVITSTIQDEVILCISISNQIKPHFEEFYKNSSISHIPIVYLQPVTGTGPNIIKNGAEAWNLSLSLRSLLENIIPVSCHKFHIFLSVPAAFSYTLGTTIGYKLRFIQLYEHDFEGEKYPNKYYPSILLPIGKGNSNGTE